MSLPVHPYSKENLEAIGEKLGIQFDDIELLKTAISTKAARQENLEIVKNDNERLSFLGDSILKAYLSEYLYKETSDSKGIMTLKRALTEKNELLAQVAKNKDIKPHLFLTLSQKYDKKGENKILSDCFEALVGAYYLDKKRYPRELTQHIVSEIMKYDNIDLMDPASKLQTFYQKNSGELPDYIYTKVGSDHDPTWYAALELDGEENQATGSSQKEARRLLAETILIKLKLQNRL